MPGSVSFCNCALVPDALTLIRPTNRALTVGRIRRSRRIRQYAPMPDALTLIRPTNRVLTVVRIRRSRRIRQYAPMPDALMLIRPTNLCLNRRPDKAFTPHPAICTDAGCAYAYPAYKFVP
ncbi:hypothetical protein DWS23_15135 [Escherichia coli]|nr:hypothetical protein [Escherichia coli]